MKRLSIIFALAALVFVSCNKEQPIVPENDVKALVAKTFTVSAPETRTVLDGFDVKWSAGDRINVIEVDKDNNFVAEREFTLQSGAGEASAVFSGEVEAADNTFYAIYPYLKLNTSLQGKTVNDDTVIDIAKPNTNQVAQAVKNGFDPNFAIMTAICDKDVFVFRHAMAYLKLIINSDNISSIVVSIPKAASSDARIFGRANVTLGTGLPSTVQGASSDKNFITVLPANGSFVKDSFYLIPITIKPGKEFKQLSLLATDSFGATCELSASPFDLNPEPGVIYNIGSPSFVFSPIISYSAPENLDSHDTSGSFNYSISTGGSLSSAEAVVYTEDGYDSLVIDEVSFDSATVYFSCQENTGENPKMAKIRLSYTGAEDVDVVIKQNAAGQTTITNTYVFYVNDEGTQTQTKNGSPGDFFTLTGSATLLCASTGSKPYFGVDSYTIEGDVYNYAKKIDSSNGLSFTTNENAKSRIVYYCASRNTNTTATMKLNEGSNTVLSSSLTWSDNKANLIKVEKDLNGGATYSFAKSGEVGLFYVIVTEIITITSD